MPQRPAARPLPARTTTRSGRPNARPSAPPPVTHVNDVGWVLLVLRAFLAFVFLYAGISKIADTSFLSSTSATGIHATLVAVRGASPIGSLLGPVQDHSFAFGLIMSIAEMAVGVGFALGLFTRIAALGGMFISLSLFLTVSWGASPWYTGADIVYLFAITPLLIAGSGGVYSLDGWLAKAAREHPGVGEDRTRRVLLGGATAVGVLALLGIASLARGSGSSAPSASPTSGGSTGAAGNGSGKELIAAADVSVGDAKQVKDPSNGEPAWVLQLSAGQFTAVSAVCPHEQCTVGFVSASAGFACPCHGSRFAADGKLLAGPATRGLSAIAVTVTDGAVRRS